MCRSVVSLLLILLLLNVLPVTLNCDSRSQVAYDTPQVYESQRTIANTPHVPIAINGDANFSATALAEGWSGNGSLQDPYVIESYDFTLVGTSPEASINISDTRVHFIIQGCTFDGPAATPSYGIYLENSTNGRIINNLITNFAHGLNVSEGSTNLIVTGNNISYNSYGIWWDASDYLTITQNLCSHNFFTGIYLNDSDNGTISGNNCSGNGDNGIHLTSWSQYNILTENICNENSNSGFRLQATIHNVFENNTSNENNVGIWTTASDASFIQWNIFANNTAGDILSDGLPSVWDYNYWSDYTGSDANADGIGDTPFNFGWVDNYPLMFPPFPVEWVQTPTDQQIEFGSYFQYDIGFNCPAPYTIQVNDSINFWTGVPTLSSGTTLDVGDYPLTVNVTNIYGYFTEAVFSVVVRDTTPPTTTHPDDFSYRVDYEIYYQLEWSLQDLSPLTFTLLRNGTEVTSYDTPTTPIFFTTNLDDDLRPGVYNYTIIAEDIWGNVATDMVLITVLPIPLLEVMLPWIIVGGIAIVVVVVIVIILKKRKSVD